MSSLFLTLAVWRRGLGLALMLGVGGVAAQTGKPVRFAPEGDYGPFVYAEADGRISGLSVELLAAVAPRAGLSVQTLPPRDLAEILVGVRAGEVELVSSLRPTPERSTFLGFSAPYVKVPAVLVMRRGEPQLRGLADLGGHRVGVGKAYAVEAFVRQHFPQVNWQAMPNDASALRALLSGQLDGVVADAASVAFIRHREALTAIEIHQAVEFEYELSFAFPRERRDIGAALERGLRELPRSERDAIVLRWINLNEVTYRPQAARWVNYLSWGLGGVTLLLALAVMLRRRRARAGKHLG